MSEKRIVKINCPSPHGKRDEICQKCELPLNHHQVSFEVLDHDQLYDVFYLHAVRDGQFDPNVSIDTRMLVLHVAGNMFGKFR